MLTGHPGHASSAESAVATRSTLQRQNHVMDSISNLLFGFFRLEEILSKHSGVFDPSTDLSVDCVKVDNIHNLVKSKTNQDREWTIVTLSCMENDLCMSSDHTAYLGVMPQSGTHLTRTRLVEELQKVIGRTGLEPNQFSGHSFTGLATVASVRGIPDSQIKLLGRLISTAFQVYLKPSITEMAQLTSRSPLLGHQDCSVSEPIQECYAMPEFILTVQSYTGRHYYT